MTENQEFEKGDEVIVHGTLWAVVEERDPDTGYYVCTDRSGGEHDFPASSLDHIRECNSKIVGISACK